MAAPEIREYHVSQNPPMIGYWKPYPAQFDIVPFPLGYQQPNFDKFDGSSVSPHEPLAHFYSPCGESTRWRSLKLQYPEKLIELACVQMCTNNLLLDLVVHLVRLARPYPDALKNEEDSMPLQRKIPKPKRVKTIIPLMALNDRKQKKYPFDDDDVHGIFEELMVTKELGASSNGMYASSNTISQLEDVFPSTLKISNDCPSGSKLGEKEPNKKTSKKHKK
ncbi:hypothetical protein V2J09_020762 [Rumex salicifolius]